MHAIVHALAQQVFAEAALLALIVSVSDLSGLLEEPSTGLRQPPVIEQRIHRLLKHALLVADDDLCRVQIHQLLQPVVAVDDAAIEVVKVGCRVVAALSSTRGAGPAGSPGARLSRGRLQTRQAYGRCILVQVAGSFYQIACNMPVIVREIAQDGFIQL